MRKDVRTHVKIFQREDNSVLELIFEVNIMGLESLQTENKDWRYLIQFDLLGRLHVILALVAIP